MKARLLIVDGEEQFVEAISERLSIRDYDVTTFLTGEEDRIRAAKISQSASSPRSILNDV